MHTLPSEMTGEVLTARDKLVMEHVGLVKIMAGRLANRLPSQVEVSELISVGVLGLIDAAGRFEPSMGVPFGGYARRRIHGAMLDALRDLDWRTVLAPPPHVRFVRSLVHDIADALEQGQSQGGACGAGQEVSTAEESRAGHVINPDGVGGGRRRRHA